MLKIYLARHGQDEDNSKGLLNGQRDTPLTSLGLEQARELATKIKEAGITFNKVYSSPLMRAYMTAQTITDTLGINKPIILDNLIERNFGDLTGQPISAIDDLPENEIIRTSTISYFPNPKNGETFEELTERAKKALATIEAENSDGAVLIVAHGDFNKAFAANYCGFDLMHVLQNMHLGNAELFLLEKGVEPEESKVFSQKQYNN